MNEHEKRITGKSKLQQLFCGHGICLATMLIMVIISVFTLARFCTNSNNQNLDSKTAYLLTNVIIYFILLITMAVSLPRVMRSKRICTVDIIVYTVGALYVIVTMFVFLDTRDDGVIQLIVSIIAFSALALSIFGTIKCRLVLRKSGFIAVCLEKCDMDAPDRMSEIPLSKAEPILSKTIEIALYKPDENIKHYVIITDESKARRRLTPAYIKDDVIYFRDDLDNMWMSNDGGFSYYRAQ